MKEAATSLAWWKQKIKVDTSAYQALPSAALATCMLTPVAFARQEDLPCLANAKPVVKDFLAELEAPIEDPAQGGKVHKVYVAIVV